jgi:hypothetical protein
MRVLICGYAVLYHIGIARIIPIVTGFHAVQPFIVVAVRECLRGARAVKKYFLSEYVAVNVSLTSLISSLYKK